MITRSEANYKPSYLAFKASSYYQKKVSNKFPINPVKLAYNISQNQPDPIYKIQAVELENFTAGLFYIKKKKSWIILYNKHLSQARINFSIAHEIGHYFMHRNLNNDPSTSLPRNSDLEKEADLFASSLLIPSDNFICFIKGKRINKKFFNDIVNKYNVSLTASILKWLEITFFNAFLIVEKDNKVIWSKISNKFTAHHMFIKKNSDFDIINNKLKVAKYKNYITYGNNKSKAIIRLYLKREQIII
jgi:Zn-dependent peptidase ImmA (M78 family)